MLKFENTYRRLNESDIDDVERCIGASLPTDLRNHYILHNGGQPNPRYFPHDGDLYDIRYFLPMKSGDKNIGFEETYRDFVLSNRCFPIGYIPFATDESDDYFLYCIRPGHFGEIAFIQWEYFGDESRFVLKLSDSLSKFLGSLVDE